MSKMEIYDPAMCCSTGVCGPSVNPELLRVATVISNLAKIGVIVKRHNLSSEPQAYIDNAKVNSYLMREGVRVLPIVLLDGDIVKIGAYPTNDEFSRWLGVPKVRFAGGSATAKAARPVKR